MVITGIESHQVTLSLGPASPGIQFLLGLGSLGLVPSIAPTLHLQSHHLALPVCSTGPVLEA